LFLGPAWIVQLMGGAKRLRALDINHRNRLSGLGQEPLF
jgi:hypothetical protein